MLNLYKKSAIAILICVVQLSLFAQPDHQNWTQFRGSQLNGRSIESGFPVNWNDSTNIAWKIPIPGKGWSSPIVFENQVWLTTADSETREIRAICVDLESGKRLHNVLIYQPEKLYRIHAVNSYATPTGAIEAGKVYLHFGRYGTTCLNTSTGEKVWERNDLQCEHIQGPGSSLFLYKEMLIVHMEGTDQQQILALDKHSGRTIWIAERPAGLYETLADIGKKAFVTPIVVNVKGRDLLISNGSSVCIAYDLETGKEVWRVMQGEDSTISMPVEGDGMVYFYTSFVTGEDGRKYAELLAVDPNGRGDIGESHIRWRMKAPILQLSTPVYVDGRLYTVDSKGEFFCLDARSGKIIWSEKLRGKFNASPLYADGHIYVCETRGKTMVYKLDPEPRRIAENKLEGEIWATPALIDGAIIMRSSKYLYRIEEQ